MNTVQYYAILEVVLFVRQVGYIGVVWAVVWYEMALLYMMPLFIHKQLVTMIIWPFHLALNYIDIYTYLHVYVFAHSLIVQFKTVYIGSRVKDVIQSYYGYVFVLSVHCFVE